MCCHRNCGKFRSCWQHGGWTIIDSIGAIELEISWKEGFGHPIDGIEDFGSIGPIVGLFVHLVLIGQIP